MECWLLVLLYFIEATFYVAIRPDLLIYFVCLSVCLSVSSHQDVLVALPTSTDHSCGEFWWIASSTQKYPVQGDKQLTYEV